MSKNYFILSNSKVVYSPGHYDNETADALAQSWAKRSPGRTFTVVMKMNVYKFPKKAKAK